MTNSSNKMAWMDGSLTGRPTAWAVVLVMGVGLMLPTGLWFAAGSQARAQSDGARDSRAEGQATDSFIVSRRSFDLLVVSSGELEAANQVMLKSEVEGTTTIVEIVPEGTQVTKGDIILRLADDAIREKLEQEELTLERSRAELAASEHSLEIERADAVASMRAAEVKLRLAELDLSKWEQGEQVKRKREIAQSIEKARRAVVRAERDAELSKQLYDEKFISLGELEDDELRAIEARNQFDMATLDERVFGAFTQPREQSKFESDVEQAKAEMNRTRSRNSIQIARAEADRSSKLRTVALRLDRYNKLKAQLDATVIRAPQDGLVVYASTGGGRWRGDPIAQGRQIRQNESLVSIPDTSQMVASLKVHEAMMSSIREGLSVAIRVDAMPSLALEGTVTQIGVMAESGGWMNPDLREYAVRVSLKSAGDPLASGLKPAMRCNGRILIGRVDDALAVPIQAVLAEGRRQFCHVRTGPTTFMRQPVKVGKSSETWAEVIEGLEEGMEVLLRRPRPGETVVDPARPVAGAGGSAPGRAAGAGAAAGS